jgi:phage baseplate assembly protein W
MSNGDPLESARRRALGQGIGSDLLDPHDIGRDLVLTTTAAGTTDLEVRDGPENLEQCLYVALTTALGDDVFNTRFGFDGLNALVEETETILIRERIRVAIIQTLKRDPRVTNIVDLKVLDQRLDPATPAPDGGSVYDRWRTLAVQVVFETVAGERSTLDFGKVAAGG